MHSLSSNKPFFAENNIKTIIDCSIQIPNTIDSEMIDLLYNYINILGRPKLRLTFSRVPKGDSKSTDFPKRKWDHRILFAFQERVS